MSCPRALVCLALLAPPIATPPAVSAADGQWSGSLAVTSDYVLRGVSQSYGRAAGQAGLAWHDASGLFAGAWGSSIEPYPYGQRTWELDLYAGYSWRIGDEWNGRAAYTRYTVPDDKRPRSYDYGELSATLGWQDRAALTLSWQPDSTGYSTRGYAHRHATGSAELTTRWPVATGLAVAASAGWYDVAPLYGMNYAAASAGLRYARGRFELGVDRYFAQSGAYLLFDDASADGEWVAHLAWRY